MPAFEWLIVSDRFSPPPSALGLSRNAVIAGSVVLFHAAALWALQSGLLRRAAEVVIPVEILSEFIEPPKPKNAPASAPPPPAPSPRSTKAPPPPRPAGHPRAQARRRRPTRPSGVIEPPPTGTAASASRSAGAARAAAGAARSALGAAAVDQRRLPAEPESRSTPP